MAVREITDSNPVKECVNVTQRTSNDLTNIRLTSNNVGTGDDTIDNTDTPQSVIATLENRKLNTNRELGSSCERDGEPTIVKEGVLFTGTDGTQSCEILGVVRNEHQYIRDTDNAISLKAQQRNTAKMDARNETEVVTVVPQMEGNKGTNATPQNGQKVGSGQPGQTGSKECEQIATSIEFLFQ